MKIFILKDGRIVLFELCYNSIYVEENCVFFRISEDNLFGFFIDDKDFLYFMEIEIYKVFDGFWIVFLFFRRNC